MTLNAIVTPHHLSAAAGQQVLIDGGNAVDAAVAAVAAQGVVAPETCGIGGDLFALVHRPGWERPRALNSSGRAGSNADAGELRRIGYTEVPRDHPLTVTIPGCIDGLVALADDLGRKDIGETLQPAIRLASEGFEVSSEQASAFTRQAEVYRANTAVADFYPGGSPVKRGDRVRRAALGVTLQRVAEEGRDAFYRGRPAEDIVDAVGGRITLDDMEGPQAEWVDPISAAVAGLSAWTIPPNSQGYLGPATLAVFEMLQPPSDPEDPLWWHLLIEAYRSLAWERDDVVADPGHLSLPAEMLLDRARLDRAVGTVDPQRTGVWPRPMGGPHSTAYLCVVDSTGLAVSIIQSNYRGTGSPFGAARSGFLLQDRGGGFSLMPGHPNELAPGKRPLHTLSPTLWADGDGPRWVLGTRGGSIQPQLIAQIAARAIIGGASLHSAQHAPRWATSEFGPFSTADLAFEPGVSPAILEDLRRRGHVIEELDGRRPGWGPVSMIALAGQGLQAAADPRVDTTSAVVF